MVELDPIDCSLVIYYKHMLAVIKILSFSILDLYSIYGSHILPSTMEPSLTPI